MVTSKTDITSTNLGSIAMCPTKYNVVSCDTSAGSASATYRGIYIGSNTVTISETRARYNGGAYGDNTTCIPLNIYGIKM